mgnify:CR=1 FL=1
MAAAGCVNVPSGDGDQTQNTDTDQQSTVDNSTDSQSDEGEDEDESESQTQPSDPLIVQSVSNMFGLMNWMGSGYVQSSTIYRNVISDGYRSLRRLHNEDSEDISQEQIDSISTTLQTVKDATGVFEPYYEDAVNYESFVDEMISDIRDSYRRGENEILKDYLRDHRDTLYYLQREEYLSSTYPGVVTFGKPYEIAAGADVVDSRDPASGLVYEVYYTEVDRQESAESFYISEGELKFKHSPFGEDVSNINLDDDPREFTVADPRELTSWFPDTSGLVASSYINVYSFDETKSGYPEDYIGDEDSISMDSKRWMSLNDEQHVSINLLQYSDESAASTAFEQIVDAGVTDGETELHGVSWDRIFYRDEENDRTIYVQLRQVGEYIIILDITTTPWERRSISVSDDEEGPITELTSLTFLGVLDEQEDSDDGS